MTRGIMIAVEGGDGSGKGVQSRLLHARLSAAGYPVDLHAEPTGGEVGRLIRRVLRHEIEMPARAMRLLFAADRAEHSERIASILDSGVSVVCERYDLSNAVYAWAESPTLDNVDWTTALDRGCVVPDITIVLDAPLDVCLARIAARGRPEIYETRDMQAKVHDGYRCAYGLLSRHVDHINATGTPEEVAALVWAVVEPRLEERICRITPHYA